MSDGAIGVMHGGTSGKWSVKVRRQAAKQASQARKQRQKKEQEEELQKMKEEIEADQMIKGLDTDQINES